jgi:hypothetical protein
MGKHTRIFNGHRYELWNAFYGKETKKKLRDSIKWAKQHGISYRTTKVSKPQKGVLMWISSP